jgi:hypothetical protein
MQIVVEPADLLVEETGWETAGLLVGLWTGDGRWRASWSGAVEARLGTRGSISHDWIWGLEADQGTEPIRSARELGATETGQGIDLDPDGGETKRTEELDQRTRKTDATRTGTGNGGQGDLAAAVTSREARWNLALIPC